MKYKVIIFSFFLLSVFLTACSDTILQKNLNKGVNIQSAGDFCTQPPDLSKMYTKFLFVIDKSGSNVNQPGATDPNNIYRADNIQQFYNSHASDVNIKWGYIAFQGSGASAYIGTDASPIFSDNPVDMQNAIALQRSNPDADGTPYKSALAIAKVAIKNDITAHPDETSRYIVFFMSDGMPTDYNAQQIDQPAGPAAFADVDDLVNLLPGQIFFSTAYYGPSNPAAADGLQQMANHGHGLFLDLNVNGTVELDKLIPPGGITGEAYFIKQGSFMVYNVNSAVCLDGSIDMDSDGDGLCDKDEIALGAPFDPQNRFSFGDGYSDYFHYFALKVSHETLTPCTDRSDEDNDLLTACEETYMKNSKPSGTTHITGDPKNPDTDGDVIIDGIEFFMLHLKSAALDNLNLYQSSTSASNTTNIGDLIRQHKNPVLPDAVVPKENVYDTKIVETGKNDQGQTCYHFTQNYLRTYQTKPVSAANALNANYAHPANGNVVLVYYIETKQNNPNDPGVYAYSIQTLDGTPATAAKGTNGGLVINTQAFKLYKVPVNP